MANQIQLQQQEKEQSEIADPRQDLFCVVYFVWYLWTGVLHSRHNYNCHFITAGSDDRVPRRPVLMQPHFECTPDPDP